MDPIEFNVYTTADEDETVRLLGEVFAQRDPPAMAVGLTPSEFEPLVRLFCPRAAADGLTVVARSGETRELIGALLTEDSASAPPDGIDRLSPKFDPIFDILGQLDAEYRADRRRNPGESLHLFLLGVAPRFGGRGIAQGLVARSLALGADRHYRMAVTEATNRTSQHIFRKQGFVERVRRSYQDHRFDGRACFGAIAGHGGPILMDKRVAT